MKHFSKASAVKLDLLLICYFHHFSILLIQPSDVKLFCNTKFPISSLLPNTSVSREIAVPAVDIVNRDRQTVGGEGDNIKVLLKMKLVYPRCVACVAQGSKGVAGCQSCS